jgi:hypothetical protein
MKRLLSAALVVALVGFVGMSPVGATGLTFLPGMTVGPDGAFYVSVNGFGFGAGEGQVSRITI